MSRSATLIKSRFRLLTLRAGLALEMKGMKPTTSRSCFTIIKEEFGLKGNKQGVYDQFSAMLDRAGS
jgi:hypothetical protein